MKRSLFLIGFFFSLFSLFAQDSTTNVFQWTVTSKKIGANQYELQFSTRGADGWQLYAPDQVLSEVPTTELQFPDSSMQRAGIFEVEGAVKSLPSVIFEGETVKIIEGASTWRQKITIRGDVPASLQGSLLYTYGRADEFYPATAYGFTVPLEGGIANTTRILIPSIDLKNPVVSCGDDEAGDKGLLSIFFLGFIGGLIALVTPCVFPLIPLTVSFFTKGLLPGARALKRHSSTGYPSLVFMPC